MSAILPFLLALLFSSLISPIADFLSKRCKIPKKPASAALVLLFFFAIVSLLYFAGARLIEEIGDLLDRLSADPDSIRLTIEQLAEKFARLGNRFSILQKALSSESLQELGLDVDRLLTDALSSLLSSLTSRLSSMAMNVAAKIPETLLFTAVFLISSFYFSADRERIGGYFTSLLPDRWQEKLPTLKEKAARTLTGYLKAYLLLMLLTFAEVFLGLTLLGTNYALLMSLIIAVVDVLPILGTGTVLIPWSILAFTTGDAKMGTGLLILYGVVLILRQLTEPRIVGNSIGLHPLATLASVYLGIRFLGLSGIFIGPIVALCIKGFGGNSDVN